MGDVQSNTKWRGAAGVKCTLCRKGLDVEKARGTCGAEFLCAVCDVQTYHTAPWPNTSGQQALSTPPVVRQRTERIPRGYVCYS